MNTPNICDNCYQNIPAGEGVYNKGGLMFCNKACLLEHQSDLEFDDDDPWEKMEPA